MKQLTAVDWIVDQMLSEGHKEMWKDMIQQAKQMEKEQMDDAYCQGCKDIIENIKAGRYYSKIYKK